jgi:glycosyltransferase involved in cell wall biosynthesis
MLLRGNADSQKLLRKMASKLRLDGNVKFVTGVLGRAELVEMIRAFDVIALPFKFLLNEPPITALEAMALGKPLITTRVSGLPELVGDERGFLVDPANETELANAIHFIARNSEEASERARKAAEYVLTLPQWNHYAKYVLELFESIVGAR